MQIAGCSVLANLACDATDTQCAIVQGPALLCVLSAMSAHGENPELVERACDVLASVTDSTDMQGVLCEVAAVPCTRVHSTALDALL
jgi:hypothetical protein